MSEFWLVSMIEARHCTCLSFLYIHLCTHFMHHHTHTKNKTKQNKTNRITEPHKQTQIDAQIVGKTPTTHEHINQICKIQNLL